VESLPAALAGAKAAILLGVRKSDEAIPPPLDGDEVREGDVAGELAFLERSVTLLRINIQDLLNQSIDREKALQEYLSSLTSYAARAEVKFRSLERGEDELQDDERRLERNIRDLQNEMEDAIQAGEGKSTTALMEDILSQQRRLAEVSSELAVTELLVKAFEDIVEPLQERLAAVSANEDALLKGVQVVDMPGVEDLGVIKTEERIRSIRKRTGSRGTSNFGGPLY
jgi:chromosome segregation ATPase